MSGKNLQISSAYPKETGDKLSKSSKPQGSGRIQLISFAVIFFNLAHSFIRFYIGCDRCQDWFHGVCVGVTQAEADQLETYVCPRCSESVTKAERQQLNGKDYETLKRLLRSLQVRLKHLGVFSV